MEWWRKPFHWEHLLSPKKSVVSGFGLGVVVVASLLAVSFLLSVGAPPPSLFYWFSGAHLETTHHPSPPESPSLAGLETPQRAPTSSPDLLIGDSRNLTVGGQESSDLVTSGAPDSENSSKNGADENSEGNSTEKGEILRGLGKEAGILEGAQTGNSSKNSSWSNATSSGNGEGARVLEKGMDGGNGSRSGGAGSGSAEGEGGILSGLGKEAGILEGTQTGNSSKNSSWSNATSSGNGEGARVLEKGMDGGNGSRSGGAGSGSAEGEGGIRVKCDIFDGRWVRDERRQYYRPGSCPYIDIDFDCHKNGRPDVEFLNWRWQPYGCDIPRLNATNFLERLRGKRILFVGDSLNRNMWESLVCILRDSVKHKKRVYEVSGRKEFKTKGYYSFRYEDYNCSVDFVRSPFLVRETFFTDVNGTKNEKLRLDLLDETTTAYTEAEIIVFNTGHWWTHEKTSRGIDYYQEGNFVYPVLEVMEAYKKALNTWARWIDTNIDSNKTRVIFRGYSLTHFRGGQWNSGGQCHKEAEPILNETFLTKYPAKMRALEQVLGQMKTPVVYLNITRLTDYRKDGHPSIYRKTYQTVDEQISAEKSQDCSHWCLPGIPDSWNELLYASLLIN